MNKPDAPNRGSLAVIFLTVFIDLLGFGMVLPLLPLYAEQFTDDAAGWRIGALMASFSFMQLFFAPLWGMASDRFGRRPVLMLGLAGSAIFYFLFGIATVQQSLSLLFITRIGAGIAGATIPTAQAYIADTTSKENRQKGMALIGMAFGFGFTFGPLIGVLAVSDGTGNPAPWPGYVAAILSTFALILAAFKLPESLNEDSSAAHRGIFDGEGFREAVKIPSILLLLAGIFVCIFSFANFESTLSLLVFRGEAGEVGDGAAQRFDFSWKQVCMTYAFIGFLLALVQGGIVRRLSGKVDEARQAAFGAICEILGFLLLVYATQQQSVGILFVSLAIVTAGFAFLQPNLNSLLSRRTDPAKQGMILGVGQSVSASARILGPLFGIRLFKYSTTSPYLVAAALMGFGLVVVLVAARKGSDYK